MSPPTDADRVRQLEEERFVAVRDQVRELAQDVAEVREQLVEVRATTSQILEAFEAFRADQVRYRCRREEQERARTGLAAWAMSVFDARVIVLLLAIAAAYFGVPLPTNVIPQIEAKAPQIDAGVP